MFSDTITIDRNKDDKLTPFAKYTLEDRYLYRDEGFQGLFARVAGAYASNAEHAQRLYQYMSDFWFMPATPILSNGGTTRGLPISCYLNDVTDNLTGIRETWDENISLASGGGGIGTHWGNIRSIGENVGERGETCGIIPFVKVMDSLTLAISQGSLRRGSAAVYLPVNHPEIEEFLDIRRPTGGDPDRKCLNMHHGIVIDNMFMHAVEKNEQYELISPKDGHVVEVVSARTLWAKILTCRIETGEPYLLWKDTTNKKRPEAHKKLGLEVQQSNLCSEITLPTGPDHLGNHRTAVCCLSSVNLVKYEEWKDDPQFIVDVMDFLDNVLQDFIDRAGPGYERAAYAAMRERSVGLGVMGFHEFLQSKMIAFESPMAKVWNRQMFNHIKLKVDEASRVLADIKGPCPDNEEAGVHERFVNKTSVAPTASISIICGTTSPCVEPWAANIFNQKTLSGTHSVRNKHLEALLESKGENTQEVWSKILRNEGSVAELQCLTQEEKDVFKTAYEINPLWIIEHAADRADLIDQAQSINVFIPADASKKDLHKIHMKAWTSGLKSLYYCRSTSLMSAEGISKQLEGDGCLSCQ